MTGFDCPGESNSWFIKQECNRWSNSAQYDRSTLLTFSSSHNVSRCLHPCPNQWHQQFEGTFPSKILQINAQVCTRSAPSLHSSLGCCSRVMHRTTRVRTSLAKKSIKRTRKYRSHQKTQSNTPANTISDNHNLLFPHLPCVPLLTRNRLAAVKATPVSNGFP